MTPAPNVHKLPGELLTRAVRVLVVGCGGTGSEIASGLPYLHQAMLAHGHPAGLDVLLLDGDVVSDFGGVEVVVDRMSSPYLAGATIDFADRIDAQGFTIDNPNAQNSCACGDSFH